MLSANTKIFIRAVKVPIDKSPLMTPSILLSVEFTPMTLSCSDGSKSILFWILIAVPLPMRDILDPVSMSICMHIPLSWPFREKSGSIGVVISSSGRAAAFAMGGRYVLFGLKGCWLLEWLLFWSL